MSFNGWFYIHFHHAEACFGKFLDSNYNNIINNYRHKYELLQEYCQDVLDDGLDLSLPWKIHMLVVHLPQWLDRHGEGMRKYAEQTAELCHHDFVQTNKRFKRGEAHADHGKNLRRSTVEYNSRRI